MSMTPLQAEVYEAREAGQTWDEIAKLTGRSRRTVRDLFDRAQKHAPGRRDPAIQAAMDALGTGMEPNTLWIKTDQYSMQLRPVPAGEVDFVERIAAAFKDIPPAPRITAPNYPLEDMMVVYPLFDCHLGMRAHAEISGEEMNLEIGARRIKEGMAKVMAGAPNAERAVIINGGDFTHQTDDKNQTRRSGHILDVDGRNVVTVLEAIEVIAACIEMALQKHQTVEYYSVPGNHDPQNWETIMIGLRERYREHDRVTIVFHLREVSVVEHGGVAIFIHHGDKRTPKDLAMFCAAEFREVWGRTSYCVLMTGHLHHLKADEFPGIYWMQLPAIGPRDHHAAGGYRSHSVMKAIGFDRESEATSNTVKL